MTQKACALYDAGVPGAGEASNMAKYAAAEAAIKCVDRAIQAHGGNGFALEYGLSRHVVGRAPHPDRARFARDDPELRGRALSGAAEELLKIPGASSGMYAPGTCSSEAGSPRDMRIL